MYYSKQHKLDMELGNKAEKIMFEPIQQLIKCKDLKMTAPNCRYDYYSKEVNTYVELKSRRCCKNQYPTTYITESKWKFLKKKFWYNSFDEEDNNNKILYVFNFEDKNCYYYYNGNDFTSKMVCRKDRGKYENKLHIEIPIELLKDF